MSSCKKLADLCADIDCQTTHLPGLTCLNFPVTIRPIDERLPGFLQSKWEKEILRYASEYNDAYPTFHKFSMMIQDQARKRNHPNISAGVSLPTTATKTGRVFKTDTTQGGDRLPEQETEKPSRTKHCIYHNRVGHDIAVCRAFRDLTLGEREHWILEERICFRCFPPNHLASARKKSVNISY